jgi:sugar lactone lactonase YvrE
MSDLHVLSNDSDLVVGGDKVAVAASDRIVVADTTGKIEGAVTGLSGAFSLAITPDGARLYAALYR